MTDPAHLATPQVNARHHQQETTVIHQDADIKQDEEARDGHQQAWRHPDSPTRNGDGGDEHDEHQDHPDAPPSKRRKLVENGNTHNVNHKASPRAVSPPWKRVHVEGPTTFLENGKRRSARTNAVPLELQPSSGKRHTRASYDKAAEKVQRPVYNDNKKPITPKHSKNPSLDAPRRPPSRASKAVAPSPSVKKESVKKPAVKAPPQKESPQVPKRKSSRTIPKSKQELVKEIKEKQAILKKLQKDRQVSEEPEVSEEGESSELSEDFTTPPPSPPLLLKKVAFRVHMLDPTVTSPLNIPGPRKYASFDAFVDTDDIEDPAQRPALSPSQICREATKRLAVQRASAANALAKSSIPTRQFEPKREYAHHDHLLAHVEFFRTLMRKERRDHRKVAEVLAHEAKRYVEAKRAKGRVKTAEELEQEQRVLWLGRFKTVVKDMARLWQTVEHEVNADRLRQYEREQQERIKGHLNRVLDRTDAMLKRHDTDMSDTDGINSETDGSSHGSDVSEDDNSEQMSASGSDSDSEDSAMAQDDEDDANMTVEQLRAKYENIPDLEPDSAAQTSVAEVGDSGEDSDPETIMDSELDSDEDDDDDDASDEEVSDEDDEAGGLLSLFSKKEIEDMAPEDAEQDESPISEHEDTLMIDQPPAPLPAPEASASTHASTPAAQDEPDHMDVEDTVQELDADRLIEHKTPEPEVDDASSSRDQSHQTSPHTSITKATEAESVSSVDHHREASEAVTPIDGSKPKPRTPIPPLLRGTLREYQHEGLDWLANLYANGRSGILADEMGLGKTIQSISLLAHLATTYEVWGPHLIVVPTSVMLNWEMEFKKFLPGFKILTYYGDIKERKQKRRGWLADDSFNVVITSYQLVLQDANSFKRRRWHYMILDEAHNIKNFRSERWQTMMTFNTRARLLLTGTPLQNNLTELWSLLFFLHYGQENEGEDDAFAGLREWSEWFKRPVESILEHGKQVLDQEDQEQVAKLHKVIRPFLLRRLKRDVEKQMPLKYEHVELCRLSKRQRQLYDGFMSRAQTRETLASGNYLSIINALMQLRKVCNHPDLFETRPINTSFAMPKSVAADFEITDLIVRRKLFGSDAFAEVDFDFLELCPVSREDMSKREFIAVSRWNAYQPLRDLRERQWRRTSTRSKIFASVDRGEVLASLESVARRARLQHIDRTMYYDAYRHHRHPVYGADLMKKVDLPLRNKVLLDSALATSRPRFWEKGAVFNAFNLVQTLDARSHAMQPLIEQYACVTPAAVAVDLPLTVLGESRVRPFRQQAVGQKFDPFHQAQMKLSIAFPDKRLLQYDCGKLQRLDKLLRQLQSGGHRALIFTQMTKVLDILEQFLNIHGHRYLRLDGATKVEQRQALTDRFNNDTRILCFILSSRSGGLGINLTGADTVIFYDLDWNPAMDRQCTDRAHRIGQTRDVHIYRFVSEHTIESNILRKANQKQLLDDVVIQEGDFTTDHMNKLSYKDMLDEEADENDVAGAAMDRVLGNNAIESKNGATVFEQAEDRDDVAAARVAEKEVQHADDGDFDDVPKAGNEDSTKGRALDPFSATDAAIAEADTQDGIQHIDEYLLRLQRFLVKDVPLVIRDRDRNRRGKNRQRDRRR